tara:strand:- start:668 stop:835 length:168 start_codon:yes stop_codon:yes gene_type:complete
LKEILYYEKGNYKKDNSYHYRRRRRMLVELDNLINSLRKRKKFAHFLEARQISNT